jgi:SAM-dependent methyltransferase
VNVLDVGRRSDIERLPFADGSFDAVVCRQRLQLLPDRNLALSEIRRVLVDGGSATITVGGSIERSAAFTALADALERHGGAYLAACVHRRFSLSEPEDLRASLAHAGFTDIAMRSSQETTSLPSAAALLRFVPRSSEHHALIGMTERVERDVLADLRRELAPWIGERGLRLTVEVNTARATR